MTSGESRPRTIGVGVDFGTSNSTVAWFDGRELRLAQLEPGTPILPSALHLTRDFEGSTGSRAIERYVHENSARLVQLVPEIVGSAAGAIEDHSTETEMTELETSRRVVFGPPEDVGLPGRLFLGLKRLLGNPAIERVMVFRRPYRLVALLTPILLRLREALDAVLEAPLEHVHVGRPVQFEGRDPGHNALALARLAESCRHAGFRGVEFHPEPLAATRSFLWRRPEVAAGTVLTVDFGGGTLDLCIVRHAGPRFEVLATAGAGIGGDRIDQLIFKRLIFPLLGEGERWPRRVEGRLIETEFPFDEFEEGLLNWAITHTLNQNKHKTKVIEALAQGGPAAVKFARLKDLINFNYSYRVFAAIKTAKAQLSEAPTSVIDIPELNLLVQFSRDELDALLADTLAQVDGLIDRVLAEARLQPSAIDLVVRTGGSSLIVAVRRLLERRFPARVTEHDPFTSVAGGLAIADYQAHVRRAQR